MLCVYWLLTWLEVSTTLVTGKETSTTEEVENLLRGWQYIVSGTNRAVVCIPRCSTRTEVYGRKLFRLFLLNTWHELMMVVYTIYIIHTNIARPHLRKVVTAAKGTVVPGGYTYFSRFHCFNPPTTFLTCFPQLIFLYFVTCIQP